MLTIAPYHRSKHQTAHHNVLLEGSQEPSSAEYQLFEAYLLLQFNCVIYPPNQSKVLHFFLLYLILFLERPKSHNLTLQLVSIRIFELFRSQWKTFLLCRYAIPSAISSQISSRDSSGIFVCFLCKWSKRVPSSRYLLECEIK